MAALRAALAGFLMAVFAATGTAPAQTVSAETISGVVVDPQERRVSGAEVRLICAGEARRVSAGADGQFSFEALPGMHSCVLRVAAPGFAPFSARVGAGRRAPWIVRLTLEPVAESVEVRGEAGVSRMAAGALMLGGDELRTISDDPREVLRYAQARAGSRGDHAIYVDGLPAERLPAVSRIAAVSVDADPFSAEYSDPGTRRIEIVTTEPDRRWRANIGGAPPTLGARNPLASDSRSHSRSVNGSASGPMPWSDASFAASVALDGTSSRPPVVAVTPGTVATSAAAQQTTSAAVVSLRFRQTLRNATSVAVETVLTDYRATNAGVGGEVLAEAGNSLQATGTEVRVTLAGTRSRAIWRSQLLGEWHEVETEATTTGAGFWVPGTFIGGGAPLAAATTTRERLLWKSVAMSPARDGRWRTGFSVERNAGRNAQVPNPAGYIVAMGWGAGTVDAPLGSRYWFTAPTTQDVALYGLSGFGEMTLFRRSDGSVKGGVRADWQSRDRPRLSPRLSGTLRRGGWTFSGGAGIFTRDWQPALFLGTAAARGDVLLQRLATRLSLSEIDPAATDGDPVVTDVAAGFSRARYVMTREAAERMLGPVRAGVEHAWWHGRYLAGTRRFPDPANTGWIDWLESNRGMNSHEVRVRLQMGSSGRNLALAYGWVHATDDGDGPFAFPARQDDLAAELARSARTPTHNLDIVGSATMPGGVRATVLATLRGASPYNIVTGLDAEGNGLQTDRGGRPRNSGDGPTYRTVSVYLFRRFNLSAVFGPRLTLPIDAGAQLDNLTGSQNWTALGNVLGSPLCGRPEGALPGRSLRVWFAIGR